MTDDTTDRRDVLDRIIRGLEEAGTGTLSRSVDESVTVLKAGATDIDEVAVIIAASIAQATKQLRWLAREAARANIEEATGLSIDGPSENDDEERAAKAASYYVEGWREAFLGGDWAGAIDAATKGAADRLPRIAYYETYTAWNDEHMRAAAIVRAANDKAPIGAQWISQRDGIVCEFCFALDGTVADEGGLFPGGVGPPPRHWNCRCFLTMGAARAASESTMSTHHLHAYPTKVDRESPMIARSLHIKAINADTRTVDFVASTDVVDAHDEIVDQGSWILDDYLANPVVLWAHDCDDLPIGRSVDVAVRNAGGGTRLECRIEFATEALNPKAEQVFQMIRSGFLKAVSVGFIPKSYRYEMRNGQEVWVWADCVLKEISVTPVPANPEALAKMKSAITRPARPGSQPDNAEQPATGAENTMSTENEKALQEKLDKNALAMAELNLELKTVSDRFEKAEKVAAELDAKVKTLETEKAAFEAQNKKLVEERDAAQKLASDLEATLIEQEVESLVGKKIKPTEKATFLRLRKTSPDLFTEMVAQRDDLGLEGTVIKAKDDDVARPLSSEAADAEALNDIEKLGAA